MINNFLTVSSQVLVLFILIAGGFICGKTKIIDDNVSKGLSNIAVYFSTPAVIIASFFRPFDSSMFKNWIVAFIVATVFHLIAIAIAFSGAHDKNSNSDSIKKFGVIFSNAGFMSLPLQMAILGDDGVFYGATYVVVFNIIVWTLGLILIGGKEAEVTPVKILLNPCVISIGVGLILFLFNLSKYIPSTVTSSINHIGNLNTPLPMFIIGYHLSKSKIIKAITDKRIWISIFLRLVVAPFFSLLLLYILKFTPLAIENTLAVSCIIAASAPCAALTTIFSEKFNKDTTLSVRLVSISTLLSIFTMPLFVALAQELL